MLGWVRCALALGIACVSSAATAQGQLPRDLLGLGPGTRLSFSPSRPKTNIRGSTDDLRWMSEVEGRLEMKAREMPPADSPAGAKLALCFKADGQGRPIDVRYCGTIGNQRFEPLARRVLAAAAPFPPPPSACLNRELNWAYAYGSR